MAKPSAEEVSAAFPEATRFARDLRAVFGDGVKIIYARNAHGQEIGRREKTDLRLPTHAEP